MVHFTLKTYTIAPKYHRKIKVVFVGVRALLNGASSKTGACPSNALTKFNDVLGQGLVIAEIVTTKDDGSDLVINTLAPQYSNNKGVDFKKVFCIKRGTKYVIDDADVGDTGKGWDMRTNLLDELESIDSNKYRDYFKIFYFDEAVNTRTVGYSWGDKYVVCFDSVSSMDTLPVHEVLHSLDLAHPFDAWSKNTPFSYHYCTTDNVMDYTPGDTKSLFHWHWQIINNKIR